MIIGQYYCDVTVDEDQTYQLPPLLNNAPANHLIGRINSSCGPGPPDITDARTHLYYLHNVTFINQAKVPTVENLGKKDLKFTSFFCWKPQFDFQSYFYITVSVFHLDTDVLPDDTLYF